MFQVNYMNMDEASPDEDNDIAVLFSDWSKKNIASYDESQPAFVIPSRSKGPVSTYLEQITILLYQALNTRDRTLLKAGGVLSWSCIFFL